MGLEERVREAWQAAVNAVKKTPAAPADLRAKQDALFGLLNVPTTEFNEKRLAELAQNGSAVEALIRVADRYPPSADVEAETKFREFLDFYKRVRGNVSEFDVLAFLHAPRTEASVAKARDWLNGKVTYVVLREFLAKRK